MGSRIPLTLGISPCPNDTFMFYALIKGKVQHPFDISVLVRDVEELNQLTLKGRLQASKVSYHLAALVIDQYDVLNAGSALGWGCGPLVVTRSLSRVEELKGANVAIPGLYTTAHLLLRLFEPEVGRVTPVLFSEIPHMVSKGAFDAGLIIHETRFTYADQGLKSLADLGAWWEQSTGLPIPLGGVVLKRGMPNEMKNALEAAIRESIRYAWANIDEVIPFMQKWAKEMDRDVMMNHVRLYVTDYSIDLGEEGKKAVDYLFRLGIEKGYLRS